MKRFFFNFRRFLDEKLRFPFFLPRIDDLEVFQKRIGDQQKPFHLEE